MRGMHGLAGLLAAAIRRLDFLFHDPHPKVVGAAQDGRDECCVEKVLGYSRVIHAE